MFLQNYSLQPDLGAIHDQTIDALGPKVCKAIIFQIGGNAERSQLGTLAEPLKKLVFHRSLQAKRWIHQALSDPYFPSEKVNDDDKRLWLQKIMK